jgi:hypothetical protein
MRTLKAAQRAVPRGAKAVSRPPRSVHRGDDGVTLIDVVVAMSLMSLFLAMFTTDILSAFRIANKSENGAVSQSQLATAFARLDKEIRYAAGISLPSSDGLTVEYLLSSNGVTRCVELTLSRTTRTLKWRRWDQGATPATWTTLASDVDIHTGANPASPDDAFTRDPDPSATVDPTKPTYNFQRLRISLDAGTAPTIRHSDLTFTALNTSSSTNSDAICAEGRTP